MEKFVLVPESTWLKWSSAATQVKSKQLSKRPSSDLSTKYQKLHTEAVQAKLPRGKKYEDILDAIDGNDRVTISENNSILLDGSDTDVDVVDFIRLIGEPRKSALHQSEIPHSFHPILELLQLDKKLRTNRYAVKAHTGTWGTFAL